ncbi:PDR/VanB family oxidoreductase [Streptomyces sp. NPDC020792]|uniref:PDR/VanB family oxidoreductase n=1 Tax=Streptomyces sp. NPDC020792 TaxID=3365089 RepID=UPI0037B931A1
MLTSSKFVTGRPGTGNQTLRVSRKDVLADGVVKLRLEEPSGGRLSHWTPGAHIDLVLPTVDGGPLVRQYSLCGDRWDATAYEVAVLREPNSQGGSRYIHDDLAIGDLLSVGGPRNNFTLAPAKRYEFIAGGIGITPIITMIASAEAMGIDWHLLYGGRSRHSMAFLEELGQYGERVKICPQDETGLLDLAFLNESTEGAKVYCCGPEPLLNAVESATPRWPDGYVRFERFVPAAQPPPVRSEPFTVELSHSRKSVTVGTDETILEAMATAGVPVLSSCSQGICGTCEVAVLDGVPDHRDSLLTDAERARGDRMFVCVSRSITERLVLDL